jgi:hypothetical protein
VKRDLLRIHIAPETDVPAVKLDLQHKLDEFAARAEERQRAARARSGEIEARRAAAELAAAEMQAQFRNALPAGSNASS